MHRLRSRLSHKVLQTHCTDIPDSLSCLGSLLLRRNFTHRLCKRSHIGQYYKDMHIFSNARYSAAVSATFGVIRRSATRSLERFKNIATWSLTPHSAKRRLKYSATSYLTPIAANTTANGSSSFSPSPRLACSQSGRQAHHAADRCLKRSAVSVHGSKSSVHRSQRYRF